MIVAKFGGTSLVNAEAVSHVTTIVTNLTQAHDQVLVVVSAHGGVTDALLALAHQAATGEPAKAAALRAHHATIAVGLGVDDQLVAFEFDRLDQLLEGIRLLGELSPRTLDHVSSLGERLSAKLVAAHMQRCGLKAQAFCAWELGLVTDGCFGNAKPTDDCPEKIRAATQPILAAGVLPVVTGFIAHSPEGHITTLGRNGSDYTAAIFAAALGAQEIQIWTDVPGVMTADPRAVEGAQLVEQLSYAEASELANYGAKVIHPATLLPAMRERVPIRVCHSQNPTQSGSRIVEVATPCSHVVKAIAHKLGISVVHVHAPQMLGKPGFLARVASAFANHDIDVDMIATSEVALSFTVENPTNLELACADIADYASVRITRERAIVCVVGDGLAESPRALAAVFGALGNGDFGVDLVSFGASRTNLGIVVKSEEAAEIVRTLHAALVPSS